MRRELEEAIVIIAYHNGNVVRIKSAVLRVFPSFQNAFEIETSLQLYSSIETICVPQLSSSSLAPSPPWHHHSLTVKPSKPAQHALGDPVTLSSIARWTDAVV